MYAKRYVFYTSGFKYGNTWASIKRQAAFENKTTGDEGHSTRILGNALSNNPQLYKLKENMITLSFLFEEFAKVRPFKIHLYKRLEPEIMIED